MASAVNFFELSQLAEASYVDFSNPDVSPKCPIPDDYKVFS